MPKKTAAEKADKIRSKAASKSNKEARKNKRYEARKGLAAGEGKKVRDNKKARRRELFKDPEAGKGKFTKKYEGKLHEGKAKSVGMSGSSFKGGLGGNSTGSLGSKAAEQKNDFLTKATEKIKTSLGATKKYDFNQFLGGSSGDRTDISSNATKGFMTKKGY